MDELRGPNIQIVLHVKEGLGFGFLRSPFIVSGSLNGYMLETDPVVPTHAPIFDAELVWEADKRRFRSLRVQNVPVKVEVYSMGTQGRKDKVGYLLLSLLGAQPCPSNKINDIKYSWHRLLGVRTEGKCCHPQVMMSLTIEDRLDTLTPRNELRMFHSNEIAFPTTTTNTNNTTSGRTVLLTLDEYIAESKKTVSTPDLQPRLICEEGLIQIGDGRHLFVLSFVIGTVENLDMLLPERTSENNEVDCYISYSVFTHEIMTDRVSAGGSSAPFNQRTLLRLRGSLRSLAAYLADCPHLVARLCARDRDVGVCSMDLRKLVPTDDLSQFVERFCNYDNALTINERCYMLRCEGTAPQDSRRPYVDIEMSLKYVGLKKDEQVSQKPIPLARSATRLESGRGERAVDSIPLQCSATSCSDVRPPTRAYTNIDASNTNRYKNASGEAVLQSSDVTELIKKMYDSFTVNQELLASRLRPATSDMQVQCGPERGDERSCQEHRGDGSRRDGEGGCPLDRGPRSVEVNTIPVRLETSRSDTYIPHEKDLVKKALTPRERNDLMQKFVDELENWKEQQQELHKCQLKRKEEYHLELLAKEWAKQRLELECKLRRGVEQCRTLATDLARATEDFRLRGFRNADRENKLLEAKKALEAHYTVKYQELREASQKMEDDMNHQLKLKDMRIEELEFKIHQLEKQVDILKNNLKNCEKEADSKYSGLTKDQTASLIQELRCLEEKLDSAVQSKAFFKEQWGRAVRELHLTKLGTRRRMLTQLQQDRRQLGGSGLDTILDQGDEAVTSQSHVDINKLKDDFYVDLLANTPALDSHSMISTTGPDGIDMFEENKNAPKNPANDKLSELIAQREQLAGQPRPDPAALRALSHEIRNMLLHCGT